MRKSLASRLETKRPLSSVTVMGTMTSFTDAPNTAVGGSFCCCCCAPELARESPTAAIRRKGGKRHHGAKPILRGWPSPSPPPGPREAGLHGWQSSNSTGCRRRMGVIEEPRAHPAHLLRDSATADSNARRPRRRPRRPPARATSADVESQPRILFLVPERNLRAGQHDAGRAHQCDLRFAGSRGRLRDSPEAAGTALRRNRATASHAASARAGARCVST